MRNKAADDAQVTELVLQAVETERGGIEIHSAAMKLRRTAISARSGRNISTRRASTSRS